MLKIGLLIVGALGALWFVIVPLFERLAPRGVVRAYQRLTMPLFRPAYGMLPRFGVIETIGRRTGRRHQVPVGGRVEGDTFWLVAGVGRQANYVRNLEANPRVRVKANGRWRSGTAQVCAGDDARKRAIRVSPINGVFLVVANRDPLTIRVDLDP